MSSDHLLELLFAQSLDGFFFMILDEPIEWGPHVDQERLLDYVFDHQRVTLVNDAMLQQYRATREQFVGLRPRDFFAHDLARGRELWREMFDKGKLHVATNERRFDGSSVDFDGDYICRRVDAGGRPHGPHARAHLPAGGTVCRRRRGEREGHRG